MLKLKTDERGFTLIELLVTIAIVAVISGALAMTVITLMQISPQSRDWNVALRQVQNAGYWISRDVQMSKGDIAIDTGDPFLSFTIPTGPDTNNTVEYRFEDMSDSLKRLVRVDTASGQQTMIAEYIFYNPNNGNSTCVTDNNSQCIVTGSQKEKLAVRIAATCGNTTVKRQYEATQRVPTVSE